MYSAIERAGRVAGAIWRRVAGLDIGLDTGR
jgi:hypothetical protein